MKQGDKFTQQFTVSPSVYDGFIGAFADRNPMHTDADFAVSRGFKEKVMHGNILNGFVSYFIGMCLPQPNVIIQAQSIKYSMPVYLNDVLEFTAEITGMFDAVNTCEFKFHFKNAEGKKVARGEIQIGLLS